MTGHQRRCDERRLHVIGFIHEIENALKVCGERPFNLEGGTCGKLSAVEKDEPLVRVTARVEVHFPQLGRHVAQVAELKTVMKWAAGHLIEELALDRRDVVAGNRLYGRETDQTQRAGRSRW
jgi:hypothetical protein